MRTQVQANALASFFFCLHVLSVVCVPHVDCSGLTCWGLGVTA